MKNEYFNSLGRPYTLNDFDDFFLQEEMGEFASLNRIKDTINKFSGENDFDGKPVLGMNKNNFPFLNAVILKENKGEGEIKYLGKIASQKDWVVESFSLIETESMLQHKYPVEIRFRLVTHGDKFREGGKLETDTIYLSVNGNEPITYEEFRSLNSDSLYSPSANDFHAIKNLAIGETHRFGMDIPVTRVVLNRADKGMLIKKIEREVYEKLPFDKPFSEMEVAIMFDMSFDDAKIVMLSLLDEGWVEPYADEKIQPNEYQGNFYLKSDERETELMREAEMSRDMDIKQIMAEGGGVGNWVNYDKNHLINTQSGMIVLKGTDLNNISNKDIKGFEKLGFGKYEIGGGVSNERILEFTIPIWAVSSLINSDESGLEEEDIEKLNRFVDKTVKNYGNANFMLGDKSDETEFNWRNDIDGNLGGNTTTLYLIPSNTYAKGGMTDCGCVHYAGGGLVEDMTPYEFFQKIDLSVLPEQVSEYIKSNFLNNTELENVDSEDADFVTLRSLLITKFPKAFGEEGVTKVDKSENLIRFEQEVKDLKELLEFIDDKNEIKRIKSEIKDLEELIDLEKEMLGDSFKAGGSVSMSDVKRLLNEINSESGATFYLSFAYGTNELWAIDKQGNDHRIEVGSPKNIREALIKNRYSKKYTKYN